MGTYTPQPGTIPHRAIAFLQKQETGAELAAAVLCEELGTDTNSFSTCMRPAREAGLVHARKEGRLLMWSLGDGTPDLAPRERDDAEENVPPRQGLAAASDADEFNAALWADGDLVIFGAQLNEDNSVTLNAKQTRTLCQLLAGQGA